MKRILLATIVISFVGLLSFSFGDCKSVGIAESSTKSYLDEDKRQVPETTTDFPKTTASSQLNYDAESFNYTHFHSNRSLYEELKEATTLNPLQSGEFTTTEFGAYDEENSSTNEIKMNSFEDETSIEKRFRIDENEFRTNNTKEERRILTEGVMDEETIKYDQKTNKLVKIDDSNETTEVPSSSTKPTVTSAKKGKHLDLLQSESDNVNMTIPNNAEVWTLAGMKNVVPKSYNNHHDESTEDGNRRHETKMTSNAKNILDWEAIARMTDLEISHSNERMMTTAESDLSTTIKMNSDETTTEFFKESRTINSDESSLEELLPSSKNGKGISQLTTMNTESPETTENSIELINSTKQRDGDDDLLTISSALSGTTETSPSPTTSTKVTQPSSTTTTMTKKVTTTRKTLPNSREEILSTIPSKSSTSTTSTRKTTSTSVSDDEDEILAASSSNPGVFRVTTTYGPTVIIDEKDSDKYHTFHDSTSTTADSIAITTEQQRIDKTDTEENTDNSSGLGVISAVISVILVLSLGALAYYIIKRRKQQKTNQRCRPVPVGLDAYSLDNVSVYNSVRRKANALRASKRSYDNSAFEDPTLRNNVLDIQTLKDFAKNRKSIEDEFKHIPQVTARIDDVPDNVAEKNRFANVLPLNQTRVMLKRINDDEKSEYINANYVKGTKDTANYYIATQAPLESTISDFWRMMWEQNSRVIIMLTDFHENGIEKCAQYVPASVIIDNTQTFGDFEVTLKSREVKGKYALSKIHLKNLQSKTWREITHFWYSWPERGCPNDEMSVINLLLEARTFLKTTSADNLDENSNMDDKEKVSTLDKSRSLQKFQGPLTVHCNNGVGRTGAIIACDIVLRYLEVPPRQIDIPQIVYTIRRARASSIRTKDQYEFIYNIANAYAATLTTSDQ